MKQFLKEFVEDPDGKSSMTRFSMFGLTVAAIAVAGAWIYCVVVIPEKMTTQITCGFGAVLGAIIANGVVALNSRNQDRGNGKEG